MTANKINSLLQGYFYCQAVILLSNNLRKTASTEYAYCTTLETPNIIHSDL
jgi:hypothetical protein